MICASEQSVIVDSSIYKQVKEEFTKRGCHFLNKTELDKVRKTIIINGSLNAKIVGQSAYNIGKLSGIEVPETTKISLAKLLLLTFQKNSHTRSYLLFLLCIRQRILMMP